MRVTSSDDWFSVSIVVDFSSDRNEVNTDESILGFIPCYLEIP
ncbi:MULTISPECIES: hypothetical protein [Nostoc]|nr:MULTISPECIES: hypothetical protein [Nostoc]